MLNASEYWNTFILKQQLKYKEKQKGLALKEKYAKETPNFPSFFYPNRTYVQEARMEQYRCEHQRKNA